MNVENADKKHVTSAPLIYGILGGVFLTMLDSISSGPLWRMLFAITGFVLIAALAAAYTRGLYKGLAKQEP